MPKKYAFSKTFTYQGKRYRVWSDSTDDLAAKVAMKKRDLKENKKTIDRTMLVQDWCDEYLDTYKGASVAYSTYKLLESILNKWIKPELGKMKMKDVKQIHCQNLMNKMSGNSGKHIKRVRFLLLDIFEKAISNGVALDNPVKGTTMPKAKDGSHRTITARERALLLTICETHKYGLWALFMLKTGARPGETARVYGRHIDMKKRRIFLDGTKTEKAKRYVPMSDELYKRFEQIELEPFGLVFKNQAGQKLTKDNLRNRWKQIWKEMNIEAGCVTDYGELERLVAPYPIATDLTAYCLRHTYCTDLCAAGVKIEEAADFMGHTNLDMVYKIYRHFSQESFDRAAEAINKHETKKTRCETRKKVSPKVVEM